MIAVYADSEIGGRISASVASSGETWLSADGQVAKSYAESGGEDDTDAVYTVKGSRPSAT